jgi:hypothetical protein
MNVSRDGTTFPGCHSDMDITTLIGLAAAVIPKPTVRGVPVPECLKLATLPRKRLFGKVCGVRPCVFKAFAPVNGNGDT